MSRTAEVKGTTVAYHADYGRGARPAINVKVRGFDSATFDRLAASIGEQETENLFEAGWERMVEQFWMDAEVMADGLGLGPIESEGRSGGWLVFADGRDPQDFGGKARIDWLRAYRQMVDWCAEQVRSAPAEQARIAEEIANRRAVAP